MCVTVRGLNPTPGGVSVADTVALGRLEREVSLIFQPDVLQIIV